jgi:hypothetical protein
MRKSFFVFAAATTSLTAHAANGLNFDFNKIADAEYKKLVEPVTTPMRYMFSTPAKSTGILGFDLGVAATFVKLPADAINVAKTSVSGGDDIPSTLPVPRLTAQKGLPLGIDLGINASVVPGTNIKLLGGGLQYQIGLPVPVLPLYAAARAGYTTLLGLEELSSTHLNIEGLVSAGMPAGVSAILDIEPWIGFGADFATAKSTIKYTEANTTLEVKPEHEWTEKYTLAGVRLSLGFLRIGAEGHFSMDSRPTMYTVKAAIGF